MQTPHRETAVSIPLTPTRSDLYWRRIFNKVFIITTAFSIADTLPFVFILKLIFKSESHIYTTSQEC